jgi:RNA recognition motif-containing protein
MLTFMLTPLGRILIAFTGKRPSGVAFVEFDSPAEASAALQGKSNQIMGGRYIEIFPSDPVEMSKYQ